MKKLLLVLMAFPLSLSLYAQHYEANWASLNQRGIPSWFHRAKFGIFIHWGVYSVPSYAPVRPNSGDSYAEWYWNSLENKDRHSYKDVNAFHDKNYGKDFPYQKFESMFRAELFD